METKKKPIYQRIILKLSGEILQGAEGFGISEDVLNHISKEIKNLVKMGIQVGIVIGGGNLFRGACLKKTAINRIVGDQIGMLATIMNSLAMLDTLNRNHVNTYVMSAIPISGICNNYSWFEAFTLLRNNLVIIFAAGTGNPFFTTDSAACLRAIEMKADAVLKATKVEGVFSADPLKYPDAMLYNKLSYQDALKKELRIMDLTAFILARDHNLPIHVFNINKHDALYRVVTGDKEGTLITH